MVIDPHHYQNYFLDYLADALWTEYFDQRELLAWADGLMLQSNAPRQWSIHLSLYGDHNFPESREHPYITCELNSGGSGFPSLRPGYVRCYESFLWAKHTQGRLSKPELVAQYINVSGNEDLDPARLLDEVHKESGMWLALQLLCDSTICTTVCLICSTSMCKSLDAKLFFCEL